MKTNCMKKSMMVLAIAGIIGLLAGFLFVTSAATITYTVSAWGPNQYPAPTTPPEGSPWGVDGYPGDTLEMVTYTGTLNLTTGTYVLKINTFGWTIDYTYGGTETAWDYPDNWSDISHDITAVRSISFDGGPSGSLSQTMLLENTWDNDYVTIDEGDTASFIGDGYRIDVTPLGVNEFGGTNFSGGNPWVQPNVDVSARFEVEVIESYEVAIDIKPGSDPNSINLGSKGVLPVAVLSTDDFHAAWIDPSTIGFAGAAPLRWALEDVDGDGDQDLVLHFKTHELGLSEDSTSAELTGKTFGGVSLGGSDAVRIVPKKK